MKRGDRDCSSGTSESWEKALDGTPYGGLIHNWLATYTMKKAFLATGLFDWKPTSYYAKPGDLYLNEGQHVAMCLQNDSSADLLGEFWIAEDGSILPESQEQVNMLLRSSFRPEFLNRLDEIIMFKPLTKDDIVYIVDLQVKELNERLSDKEIKVSILPEAKQFIVDNGYDPVYGARPLKRYIQKNVETLAARIILEGKVEEGDTIEIGLTEGVLSANCLKKDEK